MRDCRFCHGPEHEGDCVFVKQCRRCGADVECTDHDDVVLSCRACQPRQLAELVRRPAWMGPGSWDVHQAINQRAHEVLSWNASPSVRSWRELYGSVRGEGSAELGRQWWREAARKAGVIATALLLAACGGLAPVKRPLVLQSRAPVQYEITLVYPGLHGGEVDELLQAEVQQCKDRLACPAPVARVLDFKEETKPPKDGETEPQRSTTISGTLQCGGGR